MIWPATPRQQHLLRYIAGYQQAHGGISPSVRECAAALDINTSNAFRMLLCLEERGQIRRLPGKCRTIKLIDQVHVPRAPDGAPLYFIAAPEGAPA